MRVNFLANDIELYWSSDEIETIPNYALRTRVFGDFLYLIPPAGDNSSGSKARVEIPINYNDVDYPAVHSAEELRNYILSYTTLFDGHTVAWYDASDTNSITKDAGTGEVSVWGDKTLAGHNLLQDTATKYPIWSADGILFDGSNDFLKTATFVYAQPAKIYLVMKQITWTINEVLMDGFGNSTLWLYQRTATPQICINSGSAITNNSNLVLDTWSIVRTLFSGATSTLQVNATAATTGDCGAGNPAGIMFGANAGLTVYGNFQIKEAIFRDIADSATDEATIYAYLKAKYVL
jgi:hypothetical protein